MRIGVFSQANSWHWQDLARAAAGQDCSLQRLEFSQITAEVQPSIETKSGVQVRAGGHPLHSFDALLLRGMPAGSLEQIVFRMDALGEVARLGIPIVNSPRAVECCVDKYLALCRLHTSGLPVPRTFVCQTRHHALQAFEMLNGRAVLKPIFGSEGRGLRRFDNTAEFGEIWLACESEQRVAYLQEFIDHPGWDLRLLLLGEKIWAMKRTSACDWRLNASLGAQTTPYQPTANEVDWARRAAAAVGAAFAGVDLVYDRQGKGYVLEVNSAPGWRYLSATVGVDIAHSLLQSLVQWASDRQTKDPLAPTIG